MTSVILHIPHSSKVIPIEFRDQFILNQNDLEEEIRLMSDHYTNELFVSEHFKDSAVIFPISRICVDPERFKDDAQEIMSKKGMGVIYTHSHDGLPIRRELTEEERLRLLDEYYYPHHRSLETKIDEALSLNNKCLIIDCHSFPGKPLPCELNQATDRPDICIGADEFHTPQRLVDECVRLFESYHLRTKVNEPLAEHSSHRTITGLVRMFGP